MIRNTSSVEKMDRLQIAKNKIDTAYTQSGTEDLLMVEIIENISNGRRISMSCLSKEDTMRLVDDLGEFKRVTASGLIRGKLIKLVIGKEIEQQYIKEAA